MTEEKEKENIPDGEQKPPIFKEIKIDDITGELQKVVSEMPEVVPDAVAAAHEKEENIQKEQNAAVDRKGLSFDPALHAADPVTGKPLFTPSGRFKKLPKANVNGVRLPETASGDLPGSPNTRMVAQTLVGVFIQGGYGVFGDDWLPEKVSGMDEQKNLEDVTEKYCSQIGLTDLPPGLVLITAFAAYGLRRVNRPRVKSVREKVGEWLKVKFASIWVWYKQRKGIKADDKKPA